MGVVNVSDSIDRNELIDYFCQKDCGFNPKECALFPCYEIEIIKSAPSAQPRRGKWIDYSDEGYVECPFCHSATNCDGNKDDLHYCFSCGAELRGASDENSIQI